MHRCWPVALASNHRRPNGSGQEAAHQWHVFPKRYMRKVRSFAIAQGLKLGTVGLLLAADGEVVKDRARLGHGLMILCPGLIFIVSFLELSFLFAIVPLVACCKTWEQIQVGSECSGLDLSKLMRASVLTSALFALAVGCFLLVSKERSLAVNMVALVVSVLGFLYLTWCYCMAELELMWFQNQIWLPEVTHNALPPLGLDSDTQCSICLLEFEAEDICTRLRCGHTFHTECIRGWLKDRKHRQCPMRCPGDPLEGCVPPRAAAPRASQPTTVSADTIGAGASSEEVGTGGLNNDVASADSPVTAAAVVVDVDEGAGCADGRLEVEL